MFSVPFSALLTTTVKEAEGSAGGATVESTSRRRSMQELDQALTRGEITPDKYAQELVNIGILPAQPGAQPAPPKDEQFDSTSIVWSCSYVADWLVVRAWPLQSVDRVSAR